MRRSTTAALLAVVALAGCEHPVASSPPASTSRPAASAPAPSATPLAPSASAAPPAPSASARPSQSRLVVHLVPIGVVPQDMIDEAVKGLREHAPVEPVVEQAQDFPASARSKEKHRYRAEALLSWLAGLPIESTGKIMGITEADIFHPKGNNPTWGILGLGSLDGRCSVLSTYRMKRKWENGGAPDALVRERLWKIAVHELGHTLGLDHCPTAGCIMEDAHGTVKTTDREKELCPSCAARYRETIRKLASSE